MRAVAIVKPVTSVKLTTIKANTCSHLKAKIELAFNIKTHSIPYSKNVLILHYKNKSLDSGKGSSHSLL